MIDRFERAFDAHEAFERADDGFEVTTTDFEGHVIATETEDWALEYTVTVRAPMLSEAVEGDVGDAIESGWFDTYELRLEDVAGAVRESVELEDYDVYEEAGDAVAVFEFEWGNADRAPDIAKAFVEYSEGTYMEGIVPGFEYQDPIASMLSQASQNGTTAGGTPL